MIGVFYCNHLNIIIIRKKKKHMDVYEVNSMRSYVECTVDYEYRLYGHPFVMTVTRIYMYI